VKRLLLVAVLVCAAAGPARAADYGLFVDVETEEDLLDLLRAEEIDDEAFETLAELLEDGVDLATADRDTLYALPNLAWADVDAIVKYRVDAGGIAEPAALVEAGALSREKLDAILPFLLQPGTGKGRAVGFHGRLRYRTMYLVGEERVPGMVFGANAGAFDGLRAGVAGVLTRNRVSDVRYDPRRDALSANASEPQFHVPKFWVEWKDDRWHAVVGTYRIGFGQRLTFDNTSRTNPNGIQADETIYHSQDLASACRESAGELGEGNSPCAGAAGAEYQSPDYKWTERLRGVALGVRRLSLGIGWLQAHAWGSYETKGIYQYELYDRGRCADPHGDGEECSAPRVYKRLDDPSVAAPALSYQALPAMYNEWLAGGNVTYFFDSRTRVGVTGYGAGAEWLARGIDLDFQEWARTPYGGPFGAVGADASWGHDWADLGVELARSFDSQPDGGGFAGLLRATGSWKAHEVETSVRYYDKAYANPYARPISEADEYEGLRARDEAGLRVLYTGRLGAFDLRGLADAWLAPSERVPMLRLRARGDWDAARWFRPGLWVEFQDRDLTATGRGACYEVADEVAGEPVPCTGERVLLGGQLQFRPVRPLVLTAKYQHKLVDDSARKFKDAGTFRQDSTAWLVATWRPIPDLRFRAQVRYLNEDLDATDYLEESVWAYLEGGWSWERILRLKLRYEVYAFLDDRASTQDRSPNPAHMIRLEADWRF